ncbi:murein hydrolase activator EnvC family protein [Allosphingosinicella sp.]|jgi:septal ring factor EnvC (AmiA/AmiB activator)|uniref:murein hydrolase activator EnvC family protein n=1 Tax=Allosphingosinicella sp. TaxID=2823234 RepID=UPI002F159CFD
MRRALLTALVVAGVGAGIAAARNAAPPEAAALAQATREAREAIERSQQLQREAAEATSEATRARAEAESLAARIQAAEADITAAEARVRIVEALAAAERARLASRQGPVVRLTAALQTMARRPPALALVRPGSLEDVVHVRSLLASTLPVIRARTAGLRAEVEVANRLKEDAARARDALLASRQELYRRRLALANFESQQRDRSQSLAESAMFESDRALALGEEARDLARRIGTREFQERLGARLAGLPGPLPRPNSGPEGRSTAPRPDYLLPVEGRLLVGVGEISDGGVHARGLTFATAPGAEIVAPANGRVRYAGRFRNYGEVVIIDHGGGWHSVITDLASINVTLDQNVRRGERIGRAGTDEPRVSIELRREGRPISIAPLLAG